MRQTHVTKRSLIETVIDQLKNIPIIKHTHHRSPTNYLVNILDLYAQPKKPSLHLTTEENQQMELLVEVQLRVA